MSTKSVIDREWRRLETSDWSGRDSTGGSEASATIDEVWRTLALGATDGENAGGA